jgi:hypothetical protein
MTVTIELSPEIEAGLAAQAAAQGLPLSQYVQHLLEGQVPPRAGAALTPAARAEAWRNVTPGLPIRTPLSDAAISRETMYDARG